MPKLTSIPSPRAPHSSLQVLSPSSPSFTSSHSFRHHRPSQHHTLFSRLRYRAFFLFTCLLAFYVLIQIWRMVDHHRQWVLMFERERMREEMLSDVLQLSSQELVQAVQAIHPISRLQCGSWVKQYADLHKRITSGKAAQRYAIFRSKTEFENGLADRISSSLSILLYAVLSNRAFQYDWEGEFPLWDFLRSDHIDWQYNGADLGNDTVLMNYVMDRGVEEFHSFYSEKDLTKIGEGKHSVVWYSDHGGVWRAFGNPVLQPKLENLGLTRENAFACLFDFLYRPTPDILQLMEDELSVLLDPNVLKIGVQIRVGDWQLVSANRYLVHPQENPRLFSHYFACARQIEMERAYPGQKVVWFTLTDMAELRQRLETLYPKRVLVTSEATVEHVVKSSSHSILGFKYAVGELWAFSLTDYHIITRKSGFGKVGAMVRANGPSVFMIDYPIQAFNFLGLGGPAVDNRKVFTFWQHTRSCKAQDADDLDFVCTDFTGI